MVWLLDSPPPSLKPLLAEVSLTSIIPPLGPLLRQRVIPPTRVHRRLLTPSDDMLKDIMFLGTAFALALMTILLIRGGRPCRSLPLLLSRLTSLPRWPTLLQLMTTLGLVHPKPRALPEPPNPHMKFIPIRKKVWLTPTRNPDAPQVQL